MCKTIKHKVRFRIPPETIYDLLADSQKRTEITGREAVLSDKVGGKFSTDFGQVTGVNVDLVPGRRLVQAWRRNDFPEGVYSMAAITLAPTPSGGTQLVLTHRGVPKPLLDQIEDYWRHVYWAPMKERANSGTRTK
jgi:uncharacterized protein YndB with AHSA1/START domain